MAMFIFPCPRCGNDAQANEAWRGQETACPHCNEKITIPSQNFTFSCPQCAKHIAVEEAWRGMEAECPHCAAAVIIPLKPSESPKVAVLKAANGSKSNPDEKPCPACGVPIKKDAVVCRHCKSSIAANALEGIMIERGKLLGDEHPNADFKCQYCNGVVSSPVNIRRDVIECPHCTKHNIVSLITKGSQTINIFTIEYHHLQTQSTAYGISVTELLTIFKRVLQQRKGKITFDKQQEGRLGGILLGAYYELHAYDSKNASVVFDFYLGDDGIAFSEMQKLYDVFIEAIWLHYNSTGASLNNQAYDTTFNSNSYRSSQLTYAIGIVAFMGLLGGLFLPVPFSEICWCLSVLAVLCELGWITFSK